jgi:hypothetical protein
LTDVAETASTASAAIHGVKRIFTSCLEREPILHTKPADPAVPVPVSYLLIIDLISQMWLKRPPQPRRPYTGSRGSSPAVLSESPSFTPSLLIQQYQYAFLDFLNMILFIVKENKKQIFALP